MKKIILSYILIVNLFCFLLYSIGLIAGTASFSRFFITVFSLFNLIALFLIYKNQHFKLSYYFLSFSYFLQSLTIFVFGIGWKLLTGPEISFYLMRKGDLMTKLDFKLFNIVSSFRVIPSDENWLIGINFIHVMICLHFYNLAKKVGRETATTHNSRHA
jgi:hypothetical protein